MLWWVYDHTVILALTATGGCDESQRQTGHPKRSPLPDPETVRARTAFRKSSSKPDKIFDNKAPDM